MNNFVSEVLNPEASVLQINESQFNVEDDSQINDIVEVSHYAHPNDTTRLGEDNNLQNETFIFEKFLKNPKKASSKQCIEVDEFESPETGIDEKNDSFESDDDAVTNKFDLSKYRMVQKDNIVPPLQIPKRNVGPFEFAEPVKANEAPDDMPFDINAETFDDSKSVEENTPVHDNIFISSKSIAVPIEEEDWTVEDVKSTQILGRKTEGCKFLYL